MQDKKRFFDILLDAIKRETEAFNYYYHASKRSLSSDSRSLLIQLAEEERKHRTLLIQEYHNLKKLLSGKDQKVFLEREEVSFHLPEKPVFRRIQTLSSVDLAVVSLPSEFVGGDFFDTFLIDDKNIMGLLIFDTMGHGLEATELKARTKVEWGKLKELYLEKKAHSLLLSPSSVITQLNRVMVDACQKLASFISMFYALLDISRNKLTYASAGHEPPILFQKEGYAELIEGNLLLGVDKNETYGETQAKIHSEDILIMFTDGVVESLNPKGEQFGRKNLIRLVERSEDKTPSGLVRRILIGLKDFMRGESITDEFTLAVAKMH